jgi:hypothetical protein
MNPFLDDGWRDIISVGSFLVTIVGFVVAFIQLHKAKSAIDAAQEATQKTLLETQQRYQRHIVSIADRFFSEVKMLVGKSIWDRASIRIGDVADQFAQAIDFDEEWAVLVNELRMWEQALSKLSINPNARFASRKWADFIVRIQQKIDQYHGPFKMEDWPP